MISTRRARSLKLDSLESLDDRITPSSGIPVHPFAAVAPVHVFHSFSSFASTHAAHPIAPPFAAHAVPAAVPVSSVSGSSMDKLGQTLDVIYQEYVTYVAHGSQGTFVSSQADRVFLRLPAGTTDGSKTEVEVSFQASKGHFDQALADMTALGVEVGPTDRVHGIITGSIPVSQLQAAANDADFTNVMPVYKPPTHVPFRPR